MIKFKSCLLILPALVLGLLLQSCSLKQRGSENLAHIVINAKSSKVASGRLSDLLSPPTPYTFYVINVEGDGIQPALFQRGSCVHLSESSAALVPALGPADDAFELSVPVGQNRLVNLFRLEFDPLKMNGDRLPLLGESPSQYFSQHDAPLNAYPILLASAQIPFLNGDQTVELTELAAPQKFPCDDGGSNGSAPVGGGPVPVTIIAPTLVSGTTNLYKVVVQAQSDAIISPLDSGSIFTNDPANSQVQVLAQTGSDPDACPIESSSTHSADLVVKAGNSCSIYFMVLNPGNLNVTGSNAVVIDLTVAEEVTRIPVLLERTLVAPTGGYTGVNNSFSTNWNYPLVYDSASLSPDPLLITQDTSGLYGNYFLASGYSYQILDLEMKSDSGSSRDISNLDFWNFPIQFNLPRKVNGTDLKEANLVVARTDAAGVVSYQSQHLDFLPLNLYNTPISIQLSLKDNTNGGIVLPVADSYIYSPGASYSYSLDLSIKGRHLMHDLSSDNAYANLTDLNFGWTSSPYVENNGPFSFVDSSGNPLDGWMVFQPAVLNSLESVAMTIPIPNLRVSSTGSTPPTVINPKPVPVLNLPAGTANAVVRVAPTDRPKR